ncbi:MAG: hypothetical protein HXL31_05010 [Prevotellaceae bacterium]|nr:hypothetical protein [Prevotellaceae bacterium]
MRILLQRHALKAGYTIGRMEINGRYFCDTLEDTDRGLRESMTEDEIAALKVKGATAIPTGTYRIDMQTRSPRFGRVLPRLVSVKGYAGVLIHSGNTAADTEGCILVGENRERGKVLNSRATLERLLVFLRAAQAEGEKIELTITRAGASSN